MTAMLLFSLAGGLLVHLTGRKDPSRDPRLTGTVLGLLCVFPFLGHLLPELRILPAAADPAAKSAAHPGFMVLQWIWLAGFAIGLLRLLAAAATLRRWRADSRLLGRQSGVEIRETTRTAGPVAAGVFRKIVFVPAGWDAWGESARQLVLEHELAHHQRRDPLWRWLAEIARAAHWFNPLVWWMAGRLAVQCEFACDRRIVAKGVPRAVYANLLCDLAGKSAPGLPAVAMAERATLEARVRHLAVPRAGAVGGVCIPLVISLAIASACALSALRPKHPAAGGFTPVEVQTRWSADPFPGN